MSPREPWALKTTDTLRPGERGTKALLARYGGRLVCVRYRCDPAGGVRLQCEPSIHHKDRRKKMIRRTILFLAAIMTLAFPGLGAADDGRAKAEVAAENPQRQVSTKATATEGIAPWNRKLHAAQRFELALEGEAVLDKETGLVWVKSPPGAKRSWSDAVNSCRWAEVGGRLGWRLPRGEELASLVDPLVAGTPKVPTGHPFLNIQPASYWSADSLESDSRFAWMVGFDEGKLNAYEKTKEMYVWCVRGGR